MKVLIGISLLQTIALVVIIAMMSNGLATTTLPAISSAKESTQNHSPDAPANSLHRFDETQLRRIIREELAAPNAASRNQDTSAKVTATLDPATATKLADQRELVSHKINSLKGIGEVSQQQMQELLDEIDQLDEQGRRQAMTMLARSINEGQIIGRL